MPTAFAHASAPPIAPIMTIIVLIGLGAMVLRKTANAWLLAGSLMMFVAAGVHMSSIGLWVGNCGELLRMLSLLCAIYTAKAQKTEKRITQAMMAV